MDLVFKKGCTFLSNFRPLTSLQTFQVKGYPFEVVLPETGRVSGAILSDQIKSLDWGIRDAERIAFAPKTVIEEVLAEIQNNVSDVFAPKEYDETVNLVANTPLTVTHNLNSNKLQIAIWDSTGLLITSSVEVNRTSVNAITIESSQTLSNVEVYIYALS